MIALKNLKLVKRISTIFKFTGSYRGITSIKERNSAEFRNFPELVTETVKMNWNICDKKNVFTETEGGFFL